MLVIIICLILKAKVSCQLLFSKQQPAKKIEKKKKKKRQAKSPFFSKLPTVWTPLTCADCLVGFHIMCSILSQTTSLNVYKNDDETFDYTEDKGPGMYGLVLYMQLRQWLSILTMVCTESKNVIVVVQEKDCIKITQTMKYTQNNSLANSK